MWKHRIGYAAVVVAALITYIVADRREPLVLLCLLVLMPVLDMILQRLAMWGISVNCHVQGTCRMGQQIAVVLEVERKNRLPLGAIRIRLVFKNVLYGDQKETTVWLLPGEQKQMTFTYLYEAADCGNVRTCAASAQYQDLFGLAVFTRAVDISRETLVYPPEIRLNMELLKRPETKSFGEMYSQKRGQDISEVSGLRDYVPGDSMNSIHWKLSGKLDELIVREFGQPSNYNTLILYEMMKKNREKEIPNSCNNAVLALTVSLSMSMLELNLEHNVGRVLNKDIQIVPVNSMDTYEQMQMNLLCKPVVEEVNGADTVYSFLRGNLRNEYTKMIYITPCYEEETARQLSREVDLTVLQIVQGRKLDYTASAGYAVISMDVDTYQETMNSVTI
ncbi:MAG: DUF58 domain-containing protein [Lachnospiraceae bacterium]